MSQVILFLLLGLGTGAVVAAIALSIVLTYRGSGVLNLAAGAVAMLAGYVLYTFRTGQLGFELPTVPAFIATLIVSMGIGVLVELVAFRPLRRAAPVAKLTASLGLMLLAVNGIQLIYGTEPLQAPAVVPTGDPVNIFGVTVPIDRFVLAGVVVVVAGVLMAAYRWSSFGVRTRAASENEDLAALDGLSPDNLALSNTVIGSLVAGGLGALAASLTSLDANTITLLVVPALAAALLGRFTSFGIAAAAGLMFGMSESLMFYVSSLEWFPDDYGRPLPGVQDLLIFLVIVAVLFWRGASLPRRGEIGEARLPSVPRPENLTKPAVIALVAGAIALIMLPFGWRAAAMNSMIFVVVALSLVVITGYVGQLSVAQLALSGVAALAVSHLDTDFGIGAPLAPILAVVIATLLGLAVGASALRVRGISLVVVTLAAAVAFENFIFYNQTWGAGGAGTPVPGLSVFGLNLGTDASFRGLDGSLPSPIYAILILVVVIFACLFVANLRRANLGMRMLAVRSNERAAAATGIDIRKIKLIAFGISSCLAGIAGVLFAYNFSSVSASSFAATVAIQVIAFVYAFGITMVRGAILAAPLATAGIGWYFSTQYILPESSVGLVSGVLGGCALLFQLRVFPDGMAGAQHEKQLEKKRRKAEGLPPIRPLPVRLAQRLLAARHSTAVKP